MCWLDAGTIAVGGIGLDDEAMVDGVEIYDAASARRLARLAGPRGLLHADGHRLYASAPQGLEIWDWRTGERTGTVPGFVPSHRHPADNTLAAIHAETLVLWKPGPLP
jgi:hypothetical protein